MGIIKDKSYSGTDSKFSWRIFWIMLFIVLLGLILRLIFIDKPDGLWNDEYVSWAIATLPLGKKFFHEIASQCHMPLYYFYLKFFIHFFGNSDLMLRLTSVIPGVLSIIAMYFVGKQFKDNKLGILCASITSLSSFLIYFSQEVRFYELLFLFSSLALLFTLRLLDKQNISNLILFIISSLLIILTHTIGFVFVFLNLIFISFELNKDEKIRKHIVKTWSVIVILGLLLFPLIFKISMSHPLSQWWSHFSLSKIGFLITDYFSPILTNLVSAPDNFFNNFSLSFAIFAIFPSIIALAGIINALKKKEYKISGLFFISLAFAIFLIIMAVLGKLVFITKYSIEIYPILILLVSFGLLEFKKNTRYVLIFAFCFLNLFYILSNPNSAPRLHRPEGHKIVANLLKNANLHNGDLILLNYYPKDRFEKYFNFGKYKVISINKGTFPQYLLTNTQDAKKDLMDNNNYFDNKLKHEIFDKLKPNQKVSIVILNDVAMYSPVQMEILLNKGDEYKKIPYLFLVFSYIKNEALKDCLNNLQIIRIEEKGSWSVITFQKVMNKAKSP